MQRVVARLIAVFDSILPRPIARRLRNIRNIREHFRCSPLADETTAPISGAVMHVADRMHGVVQRESTSLYVPHSCENSTNYRKPDGNSIGSVLCDIQPIDSIPPCCRW